MQFPIGILTAALLVLAGTAWANDAHVVGVKVQRDGPATYRFDVTVRSHDTGWSKYADRWEVVGPDGNILAVRELAHPHETEQPFTRDLGGVRLPPGITRVRVRAHDKINGFGGREVEVELPR